MFVINKLIEKKKTNKLIIKMFPSRLKEDVKFVLKNISRETINKSNPISNYKTETFTLLDNHIIEVPYRINYIDNIKDYNIFNENQKLIYHCIFSNNYDGYVREKHLKEILKDCKDWCYPFVLKLSGDYVKEIIKVIYEELKDRDNTNIKEFCLLNKEQLKYRYARMISYWNEYYREDCYKYKDYIGRKLFRECFGCSRNLN